ncbi:MAG: hypothetical protein ACYC09_02790 [Bacteroidota bacterium]
MIITTFKIYSFHICAAVAILLFSTGRSFAQIATPGYDDKLLFRGVTGITMGAVQQQWTIKDTGTFTQRSFPVSVSLPITSRMLFSITNAGAITSSGPATVQGIVDTRVSISYVFPGDKFWFIGGANFPTGKTALSATEIGLSKFISQTAFTFKVPTFGQGYGGNIGMAYATPITRRLVFGIGTSFFYRGSFEPIQLTSSSSSLDYDPGDEFSMNAGIDYTTYAKTARMSFDITATLFFDDKLSGEKIFRSGPRAMAFIVYSLRTDEYHHLLNGRVRYRLKNVFYSNGISTEYDAAVHLEGQYSVSRQLNEWLMGTGVLEMKYFTADQVPFGTGIITTGNATIGMVGTDFMFLVSDIFSPTVTLRYGMGNTTIDDIQYDVNGFEVGLGLKISL